MDNQRLPVRIIAAGLPLLVIALVFGAIGYATTTPEPAPIAPLADAAPAAQAARGAIASITSSEIVLVTEPGESLTYQMPANPAIEVLEPIDLTMVKLGDWLNGGAIPHPDTILALVSLILLTEPVTP